MDIISPWPVGILYVGRHPHADRRRLLLCRSAFPCRHQPNHLPRLGRGLLLEKEESFILFIFLGVKKKRPRAAAKGCRPTTLSGGKGFLCRSAFPCRHQPNHLPRLGRGLLLEKEESFILFIFLGAKKKRPRAAAKGCRPIGFGGKGFYVGRHSHADKRGLQPARVDALFGGKGLPPY